jgi:hypothetical protein
MVRFTFSELALASGLAAGALIPFGIAFGAVGGSEMQQFAEAVPGPARTLGGTADVQLRFVQEDGPASGHVRVEVTPETRGLNIIEARSAAQQAFLEALNEPGLGDDLSRIKVVVRLMPASHSDPGAAELTLLFLHKGGSDWTILSGE